MDKEYASYTTVDQKWVAQIPSHWEMKRLKGVFAMRKERNNPIQTDYILSLTAKQGVVPYAEKEGTGGNKPKDDLTQYNICRENDLLVNCMNVVSGAAGVSKYYGAISPVYYAFYPREDENIWYYHYIFRLITFQRSLIGLGKGILMHESDEGVLTSVRMRISMNYLGNVMLPIPPRAEQDQMVRYLNWKTSEINKLISNRKRYVAEIKSLKKSIIDDAIKCGLDATACRKNSGVYWLGDIPEHWDVVRLKKLVTLSTEKTTDSSAPYIGMENIESWTGRYVSGTEISPEGTSNVYHAGDILFGKLRPYLAKVFMPDNDGICSGEFLVFKNIKINKRFLLYYLLSPSLIDIVNSSTYGAKMPRANWNFIGNCAVPVPNLKEQEEIADYLDRATAEIDCLVKITESQISSLYDLKNKIISDVVTGNIDVRDAVIPEYEFVEEEADEDVETDSEDVEIEEQED